jgi:hypothetical protein
LIYGGINHIFGDNDFNVSDISDGDSIAVPIDRLAAFVDALPMGFAVAPVSLSMKRYSMLPYRRCVAIFLVKDGKVLVGQRRDVPGAWQLPQGGIEENESYLEAAKRELVEETGASSVKTLGLTCSKYKYKFPESSQRKFVKNGKSVQ